MMALWALSPSQLRSSKFNKVDLKRRGSEGDFAPQGVQRDALFDGMAV